MMKLLVFKEHLKNIYSKYGTYINLIVKMLSVIVSAIVINSNIGYMTRLKNPAIVIIIGVLAGFLPGAINVLIVSAFVLAHLYALSTEIAVAAAMIMLVMYLVYFRFTPKDEYLLILLPVLFFLKIPYIVPLIVGLVLTPISIISVTFGTICYYIMSYAKNNGPAITSVAEDSGIQKITTLLESLTKNKEMWLVIITFAVVVVLVYVIRRLLVDYAWTIAIVVGGITNMIVMLIGELVLKEESSINIGIMILMSIISMGIVYLLHYMILSVDYTRTEYVQFEDDDYYYYVKAVPKINVTTQNVRVKRINAGKTKRRR